MVDDGAGDDGGGVGRVLVSGRKTGWAALGS